MMIDGVCRGAGGEAGRSVFRGRPAGAGGSAFSGAGRAVAHQRGWTGRRPGGLV